MTRNLKVLGLALVAVFAMSAVAATAASAHFTTGSDSTRLTASGIGTEQKFEISATEYVNCEQVAIAGTVTVGTNEEAIEAEPAYSGNCKIVQGGTTVAGTVDMNGCKYKFTTNNEVHIVCPVNKHIEVTATGLHLQCLDVFGTTPTTPTVSYTNEGSGTTMDVKIKSEVSGITYEKTGSCGSGEFNNAKYIGEVTVTGENPTTGAHIEVTKS